MVEKKLREQRLSQLNNKKSSAQEFREQYVDTMYRAPHERKLFRKREYFKQAYLENPYIWSAIISLILGSLWLGKESELVEKLFEIFAEIMVFLTQIW